jgi:hypothetical protein
VDNLDANFAIFFAASGYECAPSDVGYWFVKHWNLLTDFLLFASFIANIHSNIRMGNSGDVGLFEI